MSLLQLEPGGRIGLLGGTFDPPHWGHFKTAISAADELNLDQLAFLPAPHPPHKTQSDCSPYPLRRQMLELCLNLDPRLRICLIEEGDLPGTTLETVLKLRESGFTEDRCTLYWLMGSDSLLDLPDWHEPEQLLNSIRVAIMPRRGYPVDQARPDHLQQVVILHTPVVDIAATDLRVQRIDLEHAVPPKVLKFIRDHGLYNL